MLNRGDLAALDDLYAPRLASAARKRITRAWGLEDTADRLRQLGLGDPRQVGPQKT